MIALLIILTLIWRPEGITGRREVEDLLVTPPMPRVITRASGPVKERIIIGNLSISQKGLARRVGTSHSAISRLESGCYKTSVDTLQWVAELLGVRLVVGFESGPRDEPVRDLVST